MHTRLRHALLLFLAVFVTLPGYSQELTGRITGVVVDENDEPLLGANVLVVGTDFGDAADGTGRFEILRVPPGSYQLTASVIGYRSATVPVTVVAGRTSEVRLELDETVIELEEVRVVAAQSRQLVTDTRTSLLRMEPKSTKSLPGVGEDVLRSLQTLPGIVAPSDFSAQLIVRGSGPDQNLIVMDDIEIFNPYRLYGLISMFNPETVTDISLITGGFPARYGDRLSAVLDVTNREGLRAHGLSGSFNASISNANLVVEGKAPFGLPGSYLLSGRRTYYDLIVGPIAKSAGLVSNDVAFPNFSDLQAKVVFGPFDGHKILVNGLRSRDGVDIVSGASRPTPDSVSAFNETNHAVLGVAWHYAPSGRLLSKTVLSFYRNDGFTDFGGSFIDPVLDRERFEGENADTSGIRLFTISAESQYRFVKYSAKQSLMYKEGRHLVDIGAGVDVLNTLLSWDVELDPTLKAILGNRGIGVIDNISQSKEYYRWNVYVQDRIELAARWYIEPGVRFDYYDLIGRSTVAPRLSVSYGLDAVTTLRASVGRFYQSPGYEKLVDQQRGGFRELDDRYARNLRAERAVHAVAGIDRMLTEDWQLRVDGYYKRFDDLLQTVVTQGTRYQTSLIPGADPRRRESWTAPQPYAADSITTIPVNASFGSAYGVELLLEKRKTSAETRLYGWLSYALAWAERNENGRWLPFDFDQRHTLNLVANYRALNWLDIGVQWRYGSNFPYTPPVGVMPRIVRSGTGEPIIQTDAAGSVIFDIDRGGPDRQNTGRKPAYHRLDVRLTASTVIWGLDWAFYLDVINVYNRANVLNYGYFVKDDVTLGVRETNMFPILPTLGMSIRF